MNCDVDMCRNFKINEVNWCRLEFDVEECSFRKKLLIANQAPSSSPSSDGLSAMPMTLGDMVERAAKHLPEGYIVDIQIEKDGYDVGLITKNGRLQLDGGDGMISDINEGISVANGFGI